jgi:hypothetical protein
VLVTPFGVKKINETIPHLHLAAGVCPYSISTEGKCRRRRRRRRRRRKNEEKEKTEKK